VLDFKIKKTVNDNTNHSKALKARHLLTLNLEWLKDTLKPYKNRV
jgi:hypothetical protein